MPPTDNLLIRRAMQAALDMDEIMAIAGDGDYTLQPSWQYPNTAYYTEAGKEKYNIHDTDLAKQLLVQAGYKNEPIVMLATSEIKSDADASIVITEQLRAVGMNIVVHVYDAAVASETRFKKHGWNINSGQFSSAPADGPLGMMRVFSGPTPSQHASPPGWNGLITELSSKSTLDERREVFSEVQQMMYDDVIALKIGDLPMKQATRSDIMNFSPYIDIRMWNVWRG
jgi:peptide/nickel transport system substrate-binding protein